MADQHSRHAAGHTTYEVREGLEGNPAADLGLRFSSSNYSEAIEFALDYLQPDAGRREVSALEIVKVDGERREVVWSYSRSRALAAREDLVGLWGFHPTQSWHVPSGARR
jgi:hypothetical protein